MTGDGATSMSATPATEDRLRVSDAERRAVVDALSRHTGEGRLQLAEFEERSSLALAATTRGDLRGLLDDLPALPGERDPATVWAGAPPPAPPAQPARIRPVRSQPRRRGGQWSGLVSLSLLLTAIWLMSGAGYFWPMWVIVPLGIGSLCHAGSHHRQDTAWRSPPAWPDGAPTVPPGA